MLNWAIKYQKMGLSVIPLRPKAKEPLYPWTEFQSRKAGEEEIKKWWNAVPNANIGIVTGTISQLAVVDLDGSKGCATGLKLGLKSSAIYLTGDGKQLWYSLGNKTEITNSVKTFPGLDIRGEGGYVVAPPSVHPNGKRYRWLRSFISTKNLDIFPINLVTTESTAPNFKGKEESWKSQRLDIAKALEEMKDGNIDNTLISVLGRLRHDGYSSEDARAFLEPHCRRVGAEDGHLEAKIENVWTRYEPKEQIRLYSSLEQSLYKPSDVFTIHSPADCDSWKQYEQCRLGKSGDAPKLQTGYPKLDALLTGGLKSERLFTIAALTGHGKTNFGIGISKNLCEYGKTVLYFSTEFGYKKVWQRYIATLANPESFREHKFNVCDSFTPNIEQVEEAIIRIKPDVFIFDYIQHVSKEKEHLTAFMKGCQFLQRKYECQGIILAQLNRGADWVEEGKRIEPRLSMIEGSATIEQASSRVLLLSMAKQTPEYYEINGYLAKNDDGDTGLIQFALYRNPYTLREL